MENEETMICPFCDGPVVMKGEHPYCPSQKIFIKSLEGKEGIQPEKIAHTTQKKVVKKIIGDGIRPATKNVDIGKVEKTPPTQIQPAEMPAQKIVPDVATQTKSQQNAKGIPDPAMVSLSGFFRRYITLIIDLLLLLPAFFVLSTLFPSGLSFDWEYSTAVPEPVTTIVFFNPLNLLYMAVVVVLYFALFEGLWGATIGKFILKERVVALDGDKAPMWRIIVRALLLPIDVWLGTPFILFSRKNQMFSDRVAGTLVVKKDLMGPPLEGSPVSGFRKFFATLFIIGIGFLVYAIVITIPKIQELNKSASFVVSAMKEAHSTGDVSELYGMFAPEMQDEISLEKFNEALNDPESVRLIEVVDADAVTFYEWQFTNNEAVVYGESNNTVFLEITLLKNSNGQWEPAFIGLY